MLCDDEKAFANVFVACLSNLLGRSCSIGGISSLNLRTLDILILCLSSYLLQQKRGCWQLLTKIYLLRKDLCWDLNPTAWWYSFYMIQVIGPVYFWPHVLLDDCWQQVDCTMVLCKATLDRCRYSCPEEFHTHLLDHGTDWGTPSLPIWLYGANCGDCEGAAHCICRYQILHLSLFLHNCHRYRVCGKTLIPIINTDW